MTDYSSIAFNAAYIDRPTVYFQFDGELVLNGGHVGRRGYFDYVRDGFGPVTTELDDAVQASSRASRTARSRRRSTSSASRPPSRCGTAGAVSASSTRSRRPHAGSTVPRAGRAGLRARASTSPGYGAGPAPPPQGGPRAARGAATLTTPAPSFTAKELVCSPIR